MRIGLLSGNSSHKRTESSPLDGSPHGTFRNKIANPVNTYDRKIEESRIDHILVLK